MDDQSIIRLLKSKPEKGVYEAILKYEGALSAMAWRILPHKQEVEECVSDAFVEMWRNIHRLDEEKGSLKGYLICIVRNKAINRYKQAKRQNTVYLSDELLNMIEQDGIEAQIILEEDTGVLLELLQELGEPEREIMLRRYFLFQPVKEIAGALHLEANQVKYKLQRTKSKLRDSLANKGVAL